MRNNGYIRICINSMQYQAHCLAWFYMTGEVPKILIDHKDGVRDNNRFDNLREATRAQNVHNQRAAQKHNKLGYLGVYLHEQSGKFRSSITINNKKKHLGLFDTPEEAHQNYLVAKRKYHPFCTI